MENDEPRMVNSTKFPGEPGFEFNSGGGESQEQGQRKGDPDRGWEQVDIRQRGWLNRKLYILQGILLNDTPVLTSKPQIPSR